MKTSWPTKKLGEVADFLDSKRRPVTASDRIPGPYPYYGANGQQDSVNDYVFDDDLVLLAEDGGYFGSKDKPVAYRISGKSWVNNHAHVLKNKSEEIDIDFLGYSLKYYDVTPFISGTTRAKLNKNQASQIPLNVPNLKTQQKIVERLNSISKAQELCDTQIQKTEEFFKSLENSLFSSADRQDHKSLFEICEQITDFVANGSFASLRENVTYRKTKDYAILLRLTDYSNNFKKDFVYVDRHAYKFLSKSALKPGDLIISNVGANLGTVFTAPDLGVPTTLGPNAVLIRSKEYDRYLYYWLKSPFGQKSIRVITSQTGQPKFNKTGLRAINIPIYDKKIQQKIVEKLDAVQNYKKLLLKQKSLLKELFDSVLNKSMRGEMDG